MASRHALYDMLGMNQSFITGTLTHSLVTYIQFGKDEYDFPKEIREKGVAAAAREKRELCSPLDR